MLNMGSPRSAQEQWDHIVTLIDLLTRLSGLQHVDALEPQPASEDERVDEWHSFLEDANDFIRKLKKDLGL